MLDISVYQDRSGFWAWEVLDEEGVYIRSCQSPFDKGLSGSGLRDSSSGCGRERAVAGWPNMRSEPNDIRLI